MRTLIKSMFITGVAIFAFAASAQAQRIDSPPGGMYRDTIYTPRQDVTSPEKQKPLPTDTMKTRPPRDKSGSDNGSNKDNSTLAGILPYTGQYRWVEDGL